MSIVLGVIADDFTGATDIAGILARSGVEVSLRTGLPEDGAPTSAPIEVIALKCRTSPVEEAVEQTQAALKWLRKNGARQIFWKYCSTFDSTEKGNIGPVSEALMRELDADQTIYCPAFPENGRSIYMGYLYTGSQLLSDGPMKDHPLTPMRDSNLARLLSPQVTGAVGNVAYPEVRRGAGEIAASLARLKTEGVSHVILDAIEDAHLHEIAVACRDFPLLTGGSALAMSLPALYEQAGWLAADAANFEKPEVSGGILMLAGSCSAMTRAQVAEFAKDNPVFRLDPMRLAATDAPVESGEGLSEALRWLDAQALEAPKLVAATAEPVELNKVQKALGVSEAGERVERALAHIARYALQRGVRKIVVAGGETSGAITTELGVSNLLVGPEIAPGVPWTFARVATGDDASTTVALALKSGNFGKETFFNDSIQLLEEK